MIVCTGMALIYVELNRGSTMTQNKAQELFHELEEQFHGIQSKISKAKDSYLASHRKDYEKAQASYQRTRKKLEEARKKVARDATRFGKSGTNAARHQLKKTQAAAVLLGEALAEAKDIMTTAQEKLDTVKPFEKKLAARAKALAAFEKDWERKKKAAEKAKTARARKRKAAAKKRKTEAKKATASIPA